MDHIYSPAVKNSSFRTMLIQSNVKSVKPSDCFVTSNYKKKKKIRWTWTDSREPLPLEWAAGRWCLPYFLSWSSSTLVQREEEKNTMRTVEKKQFILVSHWKKCVFICPASCEEEQNSNRIIFSLDKRKGCWMAGNLHSTWSDRVWGEE